MSKKRSIKKCFYFFLTALLLCYNLPKNLLCSEQGKVDYTLQFKGKTDVDIYDQDIIYGDPKTAKINVIVYQTLSCAFCQRFFLHQLPILTEKYVENGKVAFIIRTITMDKKGFFANKVLYCLKDKAPPFVGVLMKIDSDLDKLPYEDKQSKSIVGSNKKETNKESASTYKSELLKYVRWIGIDEKELSACIENPETEKIMYARMMHFIITLGRQSYPSYFINKKEKIGFMNTGEWIKCLDKELNAIEEMENEDHDSEELNKK